MDKPDNKKDVKKGGAAVCVFCGSSFGTDPAFRDAARAIGAGLAERGYSLVFGGGGLGLMGDTARAARDAGAPVKGILPGFLRDAEPPLSTGETTKIVPDLFVRKQEMLAVSDAFLVLPGGLGTYDEFFEVLTSAQLNVLAKPIIVVNVNGYFDALDALLQATIKAGFAKKMVVGLYRMAGSAEAALEILEEALKNPVR